MSEHGTFIWNELVTSDPERSGEFYTQLFGWERREVEAGPYGTYTIFHKDRRDVVGMMSPVGESGRYGNRWTAYVSVEDLNATIARAVAFGAAVIVGPDEVEGVGRACLLQDPTGALTPLMEPAANASTSG